MRLILATIGRWKGPAEKALYEDFAGRLGPAGAGLGLGPLSLIEIDERKAGQGPTRVAKEGELLLAALPAGAHLILLDERGKAHTSPDFAKMLARLRDEGVRDLGFVVGGADGHGPAIKQAARGLLSLGPMTWPHLLVRGLVAEQIYRAITILAGHPYHRV